MTGRIITCDHVVYELPDLLEWDIVCTGGVPSDSFSATCIFTPDMAEPLHKAVSFLALDGTRLLLHGIVDEYTVAETERGRTVSLQGRGYAARLLDNESRPLTYQAATLEEILRNHVTPYGITCSEMAAVKATSVYTVASGSSQWRALTDFCQTYGDFTPRFDRSGALIASPRRDGGQRLVIDDDKAVLSLTLRENHYGVLSEVLVIDKTRNAAYTVRNEEFLRRGGQCRRVVYTPGQSTWAAMRYTGEYQMAQSQGDEVRITVRLPGLENVDAGDMVRLRRSDCAIDGDYCVAEVEHASEPSGETTTLTLKKGRA